MNFPVRSLALLIACLLTLCLNSQAQAGGSITKDEVMTQICGESRTLCVTIKGLNLAEVGSAIRVGNRYPNAGERIMPYAFTGQLRNGKLPIDVTIDRDDSGKISITIKDLN